jgi:hypothetical protein
MYVSFRSWHLTELSSLYNIMKYRLSFHCVTPRRLTHQNTILRTREARTTVTQQLFVLLVRCQVLMASSIKMAIFWGVAPCNLLDTDRHFRGAYCLHHQGDCTLTMGQVSTSELSITTTLQGTTSQKTVIFCLLI